MRRPLLLFPFILVIILLLADNAESAPLQAKTDSGKYDRDQALGISQAALNRKVTGHEFTNRNNEKVNVSDYAGKPLIISLVYTSCHHVCPMLTKNLAHVVEIAQDALGEDSFSVITVGFDTEIDNPERMRLFAAERNIDIAGWDFLSADAKTIEAFSRDTGFIFFRSAKGFDHLAQTTLLDSDGRVYRQIYGVQYEPPVLVEPLKELVYGKRSDTGLVDGWINNVRLFCTLYDPNSGRYKFDYSIFIGIIISLVILVSMATFLVRAWRQNNKQQRM